MDLERKGIKALAKEASLLPQEELLQVIAGQSDLKIGIPREVSLQEKRVAISPEAVALIVAHGHQVIVESGAGDLSFYSDIDYSESGAQVVHDKKQVFGAGLVLKVEPPSLDEVEMMGMGSTLVCALNLNVQNEKLLEALSAKKVTAIAWDYIRNRTGIYPLVMAMSEIAGNTAVLLAGELLATVGGRSTMLGGVSGVRPSTVVIIGAGTVGEFAARAAIGLGAQVKLFDNRQHRLVRLQRSLGQRLWTSTLQPSVLDEALRTADVAIGALRGEGQRAPMVVSETMVSSMRDKSVIIDICIDRGGCFETSRLTSHENPTYVKDGVIHYCVPNLTSKVSRTSSEALSNILAPMILSIAKDGGVESSVRNGNMIKTGVYMYKGTLTHKGLAEERGLPYKPLDLLLGVF